MVPAKTVGAAVEEEDRRREERGGLHGLLDLPAGRQVARIAKKSLIAVS